MKIIRGLRNFTESVKNPVVTLGNFDGVHLGHQEIFRRVADRAKQIDGTSIVYTFDPHPLKILAPEQNLNLLTTFKQKVELFKANDMQIVVCADFTRRFAGIHPRDFAIMLHEKIVMNTVYVGHDYCFGKGGEGGCEYLQKMGAELGFDVEVVSAVEVDGRRVSSSLIRELLYTGAIMEANKRLGRLYSLAGKVVSGYKRGKAIGFPTANLDTPYEVIPAVGVYAVVARVGEEQWYDGVVNIGYNPTFNRDDLIVETHLLALDHDIYGSDIELYFVDRLRDEKNFESVDALKEQIKIDIKHAQSVIKNAREKHFITGLQGR